MVSNPRTVGIFVNGEAVSDRDKQKGLSLEALRGIAALVVVFWHCALAFFPEVTGIYPETYGDFGARGDIFYVLMFGTGAVWVFFVLSGFVLSRGYFARPRSASLLRGAIKRWPRLAGPVVASCILAFLLFHFDCMRFDEAAQLTHSPWLLAPHVPDHISFMDAVRVGATTFFTGESSYDNPIWTMHLEFVGSYVVFALCVLAGWLRFDLVWSLVSIGVAGVVAYSLNRPLILFPLGMALALLFVARPRSSRLGGWLLFTAGLFFLGYSGVREGVYSWGWGGNATTLCIQMTGAGLVVAGTALLPPIRGRRMDAFAAFVGRLSFPLYLVHVPLIWSIGSATMVATDSAFLATSASVAVSIGLAMAFSLFNERWTTLTDRFSAGLAGLLISRLENARSSAPRAG